MPTTQKVLYRGVAPTTNGTLYTAATTGGTVITNIIVSNASASAGTFNFTLDGIVFAQSSAVPANGFVNFDIKQVLPNTKTIAGSGSSTSISFHISGVELS
jgi:hypothetical protein